MTHYCIQGVMSAQFSPMEMTTGKETEMFLDNPKNDLLSSITVCTIPTKLRKEVSVFKECTCLQ
jgi:hypothetical protein